MPEDELPPLDIRVLKGDLERVFFFISRMRSEIRLLGLRINKLESEREPSSTEETKDL